MKKLLIVFALCFAALLCSCKEKDIDILSVAGETGVTTYTTHGSICLNGLDYESAQLNVTVLKIEDNVLYTCKPTYSPKTDSEEPETTAYALAEDAVFYTRDSDIVHLRNGNIENEVFYKEYTKEKFIKKFDKTENAKMYLWTNENGEISIAMMYTTTSTSE